jgi:hypothetical protein
VISAERSFRVCGRKRPPLGPIRGSSSRLWWETYAAGHDEGQQAPSASTTQGPQRDNAQHGD